MPFFRQFVPLRGHNHDNWMQVTHRLSHSVPVNLNAIFNFAFFGKKKKTEIVFNNIKSIFEPIIL